MENFLSKDSQKQLREKYTEALKDAWTRRDGQPDNKMVEFCLKDTAVVIPMSNGTICVMPKPSMDKDFCFGYSTCGQGMSYNECQKAHSAALDDLANYFIEKNLDDFDRRYKEVTQGSNEKGFHSHYHLSGKYWSQSKDNPLRNMTMDNTEVQEPITAEDLKNYAEAVKFVRADFEKKLKSYIKRYGTKKLRTWTYWVDE